MRGSADVISGDLDSEARRKQRLSDRAALCPPPKPEATKLTFQSLGEALLKSFGAKGIERSPGGERLVLDISIKAALERACALGMSPEDAQRRLNEAADKIKASLMECDSPIERRLLPALVMANYGEKFFTFPAELHLPKKEQLPPVGDIVVVPQFAFVRYRLDFAIIARSENSQAIFGVECDGEQYHSDPRNDVVRDSYLKGFGIEIFRFKGEAIYADPHAVAEGVAKLIAFWRNAQR